MFRDFREHRANGGMNIERCTKADATCVSCTVTNRNVRHKWTKEKDRQKSTRSPDIINVELVRGHACLNAMSRHYAVIVVELVLNLSHIRRVHCRL